MKKLAFLMLVLGSSAPASAQAKDLTLGLGYIPNVQFAPFYTAVEQGFFKAEGLNVRFEHGFASQLMPQLLAGRIDYLVGDAEDAVFARANNQAVRYFLAMYQRLPATVFSLSSKTIRTPADLRGKTVGIPGAFGSNYYALLATLRGSGLTDKDVRLQSIGFTQLEAVRAGRVDAAVGFINNEPLVLRRSGVGVNTLDMGRFYPMVGNGLMATDKTLEDKATVQKVARAVQKGIAFTLKNPQRAFEDSKKYVENLDATQLEVLNASLPLMKSAYTERNGLGFSDPQAWSKALAFLKNSGQLKSTLNATAFYSNAFLTRGVR